jgi:hypothetical protein
MGPKRLRLGSLLVATATVASLLTGLGAGSARAAASACATEGCWTAPFSPGHVFDAAPPSTVAESEEFPAAASVVMMPTGKILYWNGLQNLEGCSQAPLPADVGACATNSHSETLDLTGSAPQFQLVPTNTGDDLFCSDQRLLENGTILDSGGTHWVTEEPAGGTGVPGVDGLGELYGSRDTRTFNPQTGTWTVFSKAMHDGRWYPTMLTLPTGDAFIAGGVKKLLWNSSILTQADEAIGSPQYAQADAPLPENVHTTETWSLANGGWTLNPPVDNVELPLFARMHLLPDGDVFYSGNGQMWGPAGESINELDWNNLKVFDPAKIGTAGDPGWQNVGMLSLGAMSGSFSALMPLDTRQANWENKAQVLVAGGVIGVSPGTEIAQNISQLVSLSKSGGAWSTSVARTGDLNNRRWYSSAVVLPNGQVVTTSGADKDEVVLGGGTETPVHQAELFDPSSNSWTPLASATRDRTYHNSAILLPDGSVLVGGHSPINMGYGGMGQPIDTTPLGFAQNFKDPSFERLYPPYLFKGGEPKVLSSQSHATWDGTLEAQIAPDSAPIDHFVLTRMPAVTHITDADARTIILGAGERTGSTVKLTIPHDRAAVTPGYYYLFGMNADGRPSVATIVQIADRDYYDGRGTATPIQLADQAPLSASATAVHQVEQPASLTKAAKASPAKQTSKGTAASDAVIPVSQPAPSTRATQAWMIVLVALMGGILVRRIRMLARR